MQKWNDSISVRVLEGPAHGKVALSAPENKSDLLYYPDKGYTGRDHVVILVYGKDYYGNPVALKVKYFIRVVSNSTLTSILESGIAYDGLRNKICPHDGTLGVSGKILLRYRADGDISSGVLGNIQVTFKALDGSAVGLETTNTDGDTITLDTNAAGYGWFVDATPADNSEFLPTSRPNEWIAKVGSPTFGKMDLYTVLLHEYGHVLGLDHSSDSHDFMAVTL